MQPTTVARAAKACSRRLGGMLRALQHAGPQLHASQHAPCCVIAVWPAFSGASRHAAAQARLWYGDRRGQGESPRGGRCGSRGSCRSAALAREMRRHLLPHP